MADFPQQGGSLGTWGTEYYNFFKRQFFMSGNKGGKIAIVCKDNEVVCKNNEIVTKAKE